uniref:Homocysteine inducible ER protein with ubiquitin like domain 1 n=1 Tax=Sphenodon punctatus TaxID=8508 RepID=A0A8D0GB84_SPHPU
MEPGPATEEPFTLLIKSPAQRHPDLRLPGEPGWSVWQLKARLRLLHPDAPHEEDQKLIYSGKLLLDHLYLREILPKEKLHALHLVYNAKNPSKMQEVIAKTTEAKEQTTVPSQDPSVAFSSDGMRQREISYNEPPDTGVASTRLEPTPHPFQGMTPRFSPYTTYSMLQFSWFQQVYARQYYMQYLAATAASDDLPSARRTQEIPVAPVPAPAPLPDPFPAENQPVIQNAAPQDNPAANQNLRMNDQGGPLMEEGDEEVNRDWLDRLYSATLFYVFFNIIYFYSSMSRFFLVMVGSLLMYLHHAGWFPFRRRQVHPTPNNAPVQAAVNQDQNNNLQEENADEQGEMEVLPADEGEGEALSESQPEPPSFMGTAWLFFKAFFASLLPEGPPAVAN